MLHQSFPFGWLKLHERITATLAAKITAEKEALIDPVKQANRACTSGSAISGDQSAMMQP